MRKILLASAALTALLISAPAYAQHHGRHGADDATTPDTTPAAAPTAPTNPPANGSPTPLAGGHGRGGRDNNPATTPTPPPGAPAMIPGTPILAPGAHDPSHDNNAGRGRDNAGTHDNNAGRGGRDNHDNNAGRDNNRWNGAGRHHNNAFDAFRRAFNAPRHYRHGRYQRPQGWYSHRWTLGEFLPSLFFGRSYWIDDYTDFRLNNPPPGTVWVRYGNDALLIDEDSGEVIQVVYGIFY